MPHQCTSCHSTFPDGSKEMLSGCPNCGGNTFQYIPKGADPEDYEPESTEPPEPPVSEDSVTGRMGRAASTVREYVSAQQDDAEVTDTRGEADTTDQEDDAEVSPERTTETSEAAAETDSTEQESLEDRAQASARGEVADLSELTSGPTPSEKTTTESRSQPVRSDPESPSESRDSSRPPREDGRVVDEPNEAANTDLDTLRAELNDQFESIRIVEPGQYELNLMELYDREEHIVALREDGKYVIEVPETWRDGSDSKDRS